MAQVLRLANKSQSSTYDFLTGNLKPQDMSRYPNGDGWMTTVYTLVGRTADANIISAVNVIDELVESCDLFWNDIHRTESLWLEESATSETTKRSLIQSIVLGQIQEGKFGPLLGNTGIKYTLTIVHSTTWENTSQSSFDDWALATVYCSGATTIPIAAISGSMAARFSNLNVRGSAESSTTDITTIWGGIRPDDSTGSSDFNPIVELELGTRGSSDVALSSDSDNASPYGATDNLLSYAPTTNEFKMVWVTLDDAFSSTNYGHWIGDYAVLMRARVDPAQTVYVRMDWGYKYGTYFNRGMDVYMSSTDYQFYEMGSVSIPPFPRMISEIGAELFEFQIYSKLIGTATTLYLDYLLLVPNYHYFKITNASISNAATSYLNAVETEDGLTYVYNYDTAVNLAAQYSPNNFVYPIGGGILVIAGQGTKHNMVDQLYAPILSYYQRFRTHADT